MEKRKDWRIILTAGSVVFLILVAAGNLYAKESRQIIFLHYWTGSMSGGIDEMIKVFGDKNPDYRIRATGFEHESFKISIKVMLSAGNPPDLFSYWAGARVKAMTDKGYLAPIDDLWKQAGMDAKFPAAVAAACTYNGQKYAVPVTQHFASFFYNKKIFRDQGIEPPATWTEFLSVCAKLNKAGIPPVAMGSREHWPAQFWFDYLLLRTAGPEYRDKLMTGKAAYTDEAVQKVFSMWKDLLDNEFFTKNPNAFDWSEAAKMVFHGNAAMTLMGTWIIGLYDGQLGWHQGVDYDFFPFPEINADIPRASVGPIDVIVVSKEGKIEAAKKMLAYFSDIDSQKKMSMGSGALSPNRKIHADFYSDLQQRILTTIRETPHWAFNYDLATPPEIAEIGLKAFSDYLDRPGQWDDILKKTEQQAREIFNRQ